MAIFNMMSGDADTQRTMAKLANRLLGRTDLINWFHPTGAQGTAGLTNVNGGTATTVPSSGATRLSAGATSGGLARLYPFSPDGTNFAQHIRAGQPWLVAGRFALTTAPTTGSILSVGANNISAHLRVGVDVPNGHATNFMVDGPVGSVINSGIAFDTTMHTHLAWRVGGTTFYQIDSNAPVTGNVDVALDSGPLAWVGNGTNANQAYDLVWWQVSAPAK